MSSDLSEKVILEGLALVADCYAFPVCVHISHKDTCTHLLTSWIDKRFDYPQDFDGWNCGKITTCGRFDEICGGYKVKGKDSDIHKSFELPAGTYSVELDFIKIDSW